MILSRFRAGLILMMRRSLGVEVGGAGVAVVVGAGILRDVNSMPGATVSHSGKAGRACLFVDSLFVVKASVGLPVLGGVGRPILHPARMVIVIMKARMIFGRFLLMVICGFFVWARIRGYAEYGNAGFLE